MIVPLYNLFGDNLVIQVAVNSGKYRFLTQKGEPYVEIEDKELRVTLDAASEIASKFEKENRRPIPLNANDRKVVEKALKCFNFSSSDSVSKVLKNFDVGYKECYVDNVPSFIKPEFYEYIRVPGKPGGKKASLEVDARYIVLSMAGWVLSRVGFARVGDETIGVNVFTETRSMLYTTYGQFTGVKPETAFIILLADRAIRSNSNISSAKVYLMSDAGGQNPTVIRGEFTVDLSRLLERRDLITPELVEIAKDALDTQSGTNDFSTTVVNLVYEYLNGAKRIEDIIYYTNRYVSLAINDINEFCQKNRIYCVAYRYSQKLLREMG